MSSDDAPVPSGAAPLDSGDESEETGEPAVTSEKSSIDSVKDSELLGASREKSYGASVHFTFLAALLE
jgi:hypothetical protein